MARGIYLDNHTTTRPSPLAVSKMLTFYSDLWGVTSAPHQMGQELFPSIEESLRHIYALLGANENDDFVFTSSGAEAINQVMMSGFFDISRTTGKNQFVTSNVDEAPVLMMQGRLKQLDCVGKTVLVDKFGKITADAIAETITPRTALVSLSWANGLTGVINPVSDIAQICHERGIKFHLDATHVLGKVFFELEDIGADFISFNGDQLHAPKGTGGLYIKMGTPCTPFIVGGSEQAGLRGGSLNVPGLVALGQAAKEAFDNRDLLCTEVARLRDKLEIEVSRNLPETVVLFQDQERLPNSTVIAFPGIANEAMLFALNRKGVYASIGGGNFQQIGLILAASGIEERLCSTAISFTLSRETTEDEIERAVEIITEVAQRLRLLSSKMM
jgi:cysteine desulfurase